MTTNLSPLRERVRTATGADRELDVCIWAEFDDRDVREHNKMLLAKHRHAPYDECRLGFIDPGEHSRNFRADDGDRFFPRYTASIDAALALVEKLHPGCNWRVESMAETRASLFVAAGSKTFSGKAATPALAIVFALLASLEEK